MPHLFDPPDAPRSHARQPHRRVADVPVLEHGRIRHRLAPGPSGQPGRRRRRAGADRSDGGDRRRPHQPAGSGHLATTITSRRSRASSASSTAQGAARASSSPTPDARRSTARPWDGERRVPPADGGWQPVGPTGEPFADGLSDPARADAPTEIARRRRRVSRRRAPRRSPPASTSSKCTRRTATSFTSFSRRSSTRGPTRTAGRSRIAIRLCLEVVDAVRAVWPERLPLFVRISATDWVAGGWDIEQSVELARRLRDARRRPRRLLLGRRRVARAGSRSGPAIRCRSRSASGARRACRPAPSD